MRPKPQLLLDRPKRRTKVSVILIDWGVRESFHSLHYLNRQTADRADYELIWVEFYDRKPEGLRRMAGGEAGRSRVLDRWLVLGYPDDTLYHKHRLYNVGILAADGDVCVICDSDAVFPPTFIESIIKAFNETPGAVVHLDEVRNNNHAFYPFNYPSIEDILGPGTINWAGTTTVGLADSRDILHFANYGACMAARRRDLLAIGGADEHLDYLGYVCGPYDLTFRLVNYGRDERWLRDEYLYHTWHPNQYGWNTEHQGPHDGYHMALLAVESRVTFRVGPLVRNPWLTRSPWGRPRNVRQLLDLVGRREEPTWRAGAQPPGPGDRVYWIDRDLRGFDVFYWAGTWYGLRNGSGPLDPEKLRRGAYRELWQGRGRLELHDRLPADGRRPEAAGAGGWLPSRLWREFRAQPLYRLPSRLTRKARRLMASRTPAL
jgi:hypothetical protein